MDYPIGRNKAQLVKEIANLSWTSTFIFVFLVFLCCELYSITSRHVYNYIYNDLINHNT